MNKTEPGSFDESLDLDNWTFCFTGTAYLEDVLFVESTKIEKSIF